MSRINIKDDLTSLDLAVVNFYNFIDGCYFAADDDHDTPWFMAKIRFLEIMKQMGIISQVEFQDCYKRREAAQNDE